MALEVQTSLANALSLGERAASSKTRSNTKTSANAKTNAHAIESTASKSVTPHSFDALVNEKASASHGPQKAATSSSSRARATLPGAFARRNEAAIASNDGAAKAAKDKLVAEADRKLNGQTRDKPDADAASKLTATKGEKPDVDVETKSEDAKGEKPDVSAELGLEDTKGGETMLGGQSGQDSSQQDAHAQGTDTSTEAAADGATTADAAVADASTTQITPASLALAGSAGVVGAAASADTDASTTSVSTVAGVTGVSADTSATGLDAPNPDETVAAEGVNIEQGAKATPAKEATPTGATSANVEPDTESQPGMAQHVAAKTEEIAKEAANGTAAKAGVGGKEAGDAAGTETKTKNAGHLPSPEGPHLRGSVFTQVLSDFAAQGLHRTPDLLSGLDSPVAAAAQANRAADVQRPTPLQMLPIEIGMQAVRGAREFQIRLDPSELGRVDVKLHINDKGEVNATLVVERPETLQLLRRDANTLAQAFEQAGLKQGENSLSFSLKGENQQGQQQGNARQSSVKDSEDAALQAQIGEIAMRRVMIPNSSLDLMV